MTNFAAWGLICCICYSGLTPEQCAVDTSGQRWDVCSLKHNSENCAAQAGIEEAKPE